MIGYSFSAILDGIEAAVVHVEADVSPGIPQFSIVGLPDSSVREAKLRVRSAIKNSGFTFPSQRITVNLSPASVRKRGAGLDLAIAIAILRASGQMPPEVGARLAFCAELSLDGSLVPAEAMVNLTLGLRHGGIHQIVASHHVQWNLPIPEVEWFTFESLKGVVDTLTHAPGTLRPRAFDGALRPPTSVLTMSDVQGHENVKRALSVAAVGRHHLLMVGPPGCGKTMMAERFVSLLPPLSSLELLEVCAIQQAAGLQEPPTMHPPVRMPHHSITAAGMIGGTMQLIPGEASLAHLGVLVLDELLEFPRTTLEALREPLESRTVHLSRGGRGSCLPADFQLIGTMNPCPCGQLGYGECRCLPLEVGRYWSRLSGALADRMDMTISIQPKGSHPAAAHTRSGTPAAARVAHAREQRRHWQTKLQSSGQNRMAVLDDAAARLLDRIGNVWGLSRRAADSIVSVSLSIAAFEGRDLVQTAHVEEAISWRGQAHPSKASRM